MLIKTRNFSLNKDKMEGTFDKGDGLGWAPGYEKKFEGVGRGRPERTLGRARYTKGHSRMKGDCLKCDKFNPKAKGATGQHCKLPEMMECQK